MAVKPLILIGLLLGLTLWQQPIWVDDVSLWTRAQRQAPQSFRAAFNLSLAHRTRGEHDEATRWLTRAAFRASTQADRDRLRTHLWTLDAFGVPVCQALALRDWCSAP